MAWLDERLAAVREFGQFKNSRAIGWFDPAKRFPTATPAPAFVEKLCLLVEARPGFGHRYCEKCGGHFAEDVVLVVPGAGETFVASPCR